jgi:hypothetical protein
METFHFDKRMNSLACDHLYWSELPERFAPCPPAGASRVPPPLPTQNTQTARSSIDSRRDCEEISVVLRVVITKLPFLGRWLSVLS